MIYLRKYNESKSEKLWEKVGDDIINKLESGELNYKLIYLKKEHQRIINNYLSTLSKKGSLSLAEDSIDEKENIDNVEMYYNSTYVIEYSKEEILINADNDDYFYVVDSKAYLRHLMHVSYDRETFFKVDGIDGLIKFLEEKVVKKFDRDQRIKHIQNLFNTYTKNTSDKKLDELEKFLSK